MTEFIASALAALVVFLAVPLTWLVALILRSASNADELRQNRVARAQMWAAFGLAIIVSVFAVVFVNNEQAIPPLDPDQTRILTRGVILVVSVVSSLYWLRLYRLAR